MFLKKETSSQITQSQQNPYRLFPKSRLLSHAWMYFFCIMFSFFFFNCNWASLVAQQVKIFLLCRRPGFSPQVRKIPWRREWLLTPVFLFWKFHGQRSLQPWLQSMGLQRGKHYLATEPHIYLVYFLRLFGISFIHQN